MTTSPSLRPHWGLEPGTLFLNHGSFGACPLPVLERQRQIRERMEAQPVRFFMRELESQLDAARDALAAYVGADPDEVVFVPNATTGVNTVLRGLPLGPGDELLVTDHAYNACRNALDAVASLRGARVVCVSLPFPVDSADALAAPILQAITPSTRLALLDHVTSDTGLVLPMDRLAQELTARGVDLLVDGAHAPGMLPLDLHALGAPYYTGNCHKWICAPKGAAFLYVRKGRQANMRPLVISHGANSARTDRSRFLLEFDWTGTADPSAVLCVPAALEFMGGLLPGGWPALRESNHALVVRGRELLCAALGVPAPCPPALLGSLASVPLPRGPGPPAAGLGIDPLQDRLWYEHRIEVPIRGDPGQPTRLLRISAQVYNQEQEYARLAQLLPGLLADEARSGGALRDTHRAGEPR